MQDCEVGSSANYSIGIYPIEISAIQLSCSLNDLVSVSGVRTLHSCGAHVRTLGTFTSFMKESDDFVGTSCNIIIYRLPCEMDLTRATRSPYASRMPRKPKSVRCLRVTNVDVEVISKEEPVMYYKEIIQKCSNSDDNNKNQGLM